MFALLAGFIPLIPDLVKAGVVAWDVVDKVRQLYTEDRAMTEAERITLEAEIAKVEARIDDTSRDV